VVIPPKNRRAGRPRKSERYHAHPMIESAAARAPVASAVAPPLRIRIVSLLPSTHPASAAECCVVMIAPGWHQHSARTCVTISLHWPCRATLLVCAAVVVLAGADPCACELRKRGAPPAPQLPCVWRGVLDPEEAAAAAAALRQDFAARPAVELRGGTGADVALFDGGGGEARPQGGLAAEVRCPAPLGCTPRTQPPWHRDRRRPERPGWAGPGRAGRESSSPSTRLPRRRTLSRSRSAPRHGRGRCGGCMPATRPGAAGLCARPYTRYTATSRLISAFHCKTTVRPTCVGALRERRWCRRRRGRSAAARARRQPAAAACRGQGVGALAERRRSARAGAPCAATAAAADQREVRPPGRGLHGARGAPEPLHACMPWPQRRLRAAAGAAGRRGRPAALCAGPGGRGAAAAGRSSRHAQRGRNAGGGRCVGSVASSFQKQRCQICECIWYKVDER
jgi:hypothetical protein